MAPLRRSIKAFHKRWNTPLDNNAEFQHFKNRILAAVDEAVGECILRHPSVSTKVALIVGMRLPTQSRVEPMAGRQLAQMFATRPFDETVVYHVLDASKTERELLFSLQSLFWVLREVKCPGLALLAKLVRTAIDASPWVSVKLAERGNHVTLYPSGARLLDEGAVNDVLSWLDDHRPVAKEFENALKKYLGKDRSKYRNAVDDLRLALEKLLQRILRNRRPLEKQKEALGAWLKEKGTHAQIRNLYWQLLDGFADYQNDAIKHKAKCVPCEAEVEYMIYMTGTFMRFVLRLDGAAEVGTREQPRADQGDRVLRRRKGASPDGIQGGHDTQGNREAPAEGVDPSGSEDLPGGGHRADPRADRAGDRPAEGPADAGGAGG